MRKSFILTEYVVTVRLGLLRLSNCQNTAKKHSFIKESNERHEIETPNVHNTYLNVLNTDLHSFIGAH